MHELHNGSKHIAISRWRIYIIDGHLSSYSNSAITFILERNHRLLMNEDSNASSNLERRLLDTAIHLMTFSAPFW